MVTVSSLGSVWQLRTSPASSSFCSRAELRAYGFAVGHKAADAADPAFAREGRIGGEPSARR
jgi:hypothetical protein